MANVLREPKIINLTPHDVTVYLDSGFIKVYPSKGVARVDNVTKEVDVLDGVPVKKFYFSNIIGLPSYKEDTYYIVSVMVANRARLEGRTTDDLLMTAGLLRDDQNKVYGCTAFTQF